METLMKKLRENKDFKMKFLLGLSAVFILGVFILSQRAYELRIGDKTVGIIKSKASLNREIETLKHEMQEDYGKTDIKIGQNVKATAIFKSGSDILTDEELRSILKKNLHFKVKATALVVDNKDVTYLKNTSEVDKLLKKIKEPSIKEANGTGKFVEIKFQEKVTKAEREVDISKVLDLKEAEKLVLKGTTQEVKYKVKEGDTDWDIARAHNMRVKDLEAANPGKNLELLQIDQELSMVVPKPYITVKSLEYAKYNMPIPFETVYEDTDQMYAGDVKVKVEGIQGQKHIEAKVERINGKEVKREILKEENLSMPVSKIVIKGTKERPKTLAYGKFIMPTNRGTLTSRFGQRWGRMHKGIDLAVPVGTVVSAADGGKVIFAGKKGSFGNLVIIDHENGYHTYYAHNSKLTVSAGDRVYRGQQIAYSGNTGRSTGPHVHFEVRKDGTPVNPLTYLK